MTRFLGRRAVGLLGVVIAASVLALLAPPIVNLFTSSYRTVTHSEASLLAALAASDLLEKVTEPRFAVPEAGATHRIFGQAGPPSSETAAVEPRRLGLVLMEPFATRYRASATIDFGRADGHTNPATGRPETGLLDVGVTVFWDETGNRHQLVTKTFVADLGPLKAY